MSSHVRRARLFEGWWYTAGDCAGSCSAGGFGIPLPELSICNSIRSQAVRKHKLFALYCSYNSSNEDNICHEQRVPDYSERWLTKC